MEIPVHLETEHLILRPACPDDAAQIAEFKRDPLMREMALGRTYETTERAERDDLERAGDDENQIYVLIVLRDADRPIGYIRVNWIERPRFGWLRFALGSDRGKGHMRAALTAFITHLFSEGLHRVDAEACAKNERSIRLMEGLGFVMEARKREAHYDDGAYSDLLAFGLLRGDFEAASR